MVKNKQQWPIRLHSADLFIQQITRAVTLTKICPLLQRGVKRILTSIWSRKLPPRWAYRQDKEKRDLHAIVCYISHQFVLIALARSETLAEAANTVREILDSGAAMARLEAARD